MSELVLMVNIALGTGAIANCRPGDANGDGNVTIPEVITAVNNLLNGCAVAPTPTPTPGGSPSYAGDYNGRAGNYGVRFHVAADGSADGFFDFLSDAASVAGNGGAAEILASYDARGTADLNSGAYHLAGDVFGTPFEFMGQLPASPAAAGTLNVTIFGDTSVGTLTAGSGPPTPTPTSAPSCDSASVQVQVSNASREFNGIDSTFSVERMLLAIEQKAPDYIAGLHEVFNSQFDGTDCAQATRVRSIQITIFEVPGGLAGGQSFTLSQGGGSEAGAIVFYGEGGDGDDRVWSSSGGTLFIDSVNGSVVTLSIVGAAMTMPAGAAAGSFTLDASGMINNFARQP